MVVMLLTEQCLHFKLHLSVNITDPMIGSFLLKMTAFIQKLAKNRKSFGLIMLVLFFECKSTIIYGKKTDTAITIKSFFFLILNNKKQICRVNITANKIIHREEKYIRSPKSLCGRKEALYAPPFCGT